jgi:RND superfamily putative drug exporter
VIVDRAYPKKVHEAVMVQSAGHTAYDPAFRATVHDQLTRLHAIGGVREIDSPYSKAGGGKISPDGHTALIGFEIPGEATAVPTKRAVDRTLAATAAVSRAHQGMRVEQFGDASSEKAFDKIVQGDLQKAETTSLPITLLILLITFGALVAAGIPLILAITAVMATFGLIGPLSQLAAVDSSIQNVVLLIGLAVGVDYSLFYLRRVREERAAGKSNDAAIDAAAATSGRAARSWPRWPACTWPERRRSRRLPPARSSLSRSRCSAR